MKDEPESVPATTVSLSLPAIPESPTGLLLPLVQRFEPDDPAAFFGFVSAYGYRLPQWLQDTHRVQVKRRTNKLPALVHPPKVVGTTDASGRFSWAEAGQGDVECRYRRRLEAMPPLDGMRLWGIFHGQRKMLLDYLDGLMQSPPRAEPFAYELLASTRVVDGGLDLYTPVEEARGPFTGPGRMTPFVRCRLEALSACRPGEPGLGVCEYCRRIFTVTRAGQRYGRFCPGFDCAKRDHERRYAATDYRREYQRRYKRLARLRASARQADVRAAEKKFEAWKQTHAPRREEV